MQAEELIELADRTICQLFADTGGVPEARVWIHTKKRIITVPCKPRGPAEEGKMRAIICAMIYAARKTGVFEGAVMMAEAWMSIVKPPHKLSYSRPELDPNRSAALVRNLPVGQALLATATDIPAGMAVASIVDVELLPDGSTTRNRLPGDKPVDSVDEIAQESAR